MIRRIDLLRHGEPVGGRMYRGQLDHPLSDRGWAEMRAAVGGMNHWDAIFHSPLLRCSAFAEQLAGQLDIPAQADERLKEIGFGVWEGKTRADIEALEAGALRRFYLDPVNHQPEGAERLRAFYLRVGEAWEALSTQEVYARPLVVAHAGVIRAIICQVLKAPLLSMYRLQIPSAGLITIQFGEQRPPSVLF